jgi:hypothetical protein
MYLVSLIWPFLLYTADYHKILQKNTILHRFVPLTVNHKNKLNKMHCRRIYTDTVNFGLDVLCLVHR